MLEVIDQGRCTDRHPVPLLFVHGAAHAAWCWGEHFLDFFADKGFRAIARAYHVRAEIFPNMGHDVMLEPGWQAVAERMEGWLGDQGL